MCLVSLERTHSTSVGSLYTSNEFSKALPGSEASSYLSPKQRVPRDESGYCHVLQWVSCFVLIFQVWFFSHRM